VVVKEFLYVESRQYRLCLLDTVCFFAILK
jgi:hypothetical protein